MADMCDTCGDGVVDLLKKLLAESRDSFIRLGQINQSVAAGGGGGGGGNVNLTGIIGVAPSVDCGTADTGTLRVAQATDCPVTVIQTAASEFNSQVQGNVAHDAVDSGNPVKTGSKAIAFGTNPTAVAAADRTDNYANRAGVPFVLGGHPNIQTLRVNYTTAQTDAAIITVGAGAKIVVTQIVVAADTGNSVNTTVRIGFAVAVTPTGAGVVVSHPGVAPGSGISRGSGSGIVGVGADGEDLRITSTVPTTGSIDVNVSYFTIES